MVVIKDLYYLLFNFLAILSFLLIDILYNEHILVCIFT
ncbi:hypothetical protein ECH_0456 [Ehrlichia chaffeensis str. Arkansas]|uniref:Uncharacterized protein n=1 Tax=Ehrlichia chaffeensis (strain ATCC CRL-10679 / Arkansas) TaxID=205920 RepID=Q2GH09_EHRCR|nr:hypothetical protein ECH_0456 [Ehrlichia chaffeensis str. Arkansas]